MHAPKLRRRIGHLTVLFTAVPIFVVTVTPAGHAKETASGGRCGMAPPLRPASFPAHPGVDNTFFPLRPGTQWTLTGTVGASTHKVVTTVTDLTKTVAGVTAVVVRDDDMNGNQLQESELALFAQDREGTVWALGEYPEEYDDNGNLTGAPNTWVAGIDKARAGIAMLARPRVGVPYSQGSSPTIAFLDCAKPVQTGTSLSVPAGTFNDVLQTDEWSPLDKEAGHQEKFYAPHVGVIKTTPVGGDSPETLALDQMTTLSPAARAAADSAALAMDARGHTVSPQVWGLTEPAH